MRKINKLIFIKVDFMLGNFMEDIGIAPEQFENACKEGKKYQLSFDQVSNIYV